MMNLMNLIPTAVECHLLCTCRARKISLFQKMPHPQPHPVAQNSWVADLWRDKFLLLSSLHLCFDEICCFFLFLKDTLKSLCSHNSVTQCEIVQRPFSSLLHNQKGAECYDMNSRKYSTKQSYKLFIRKCRGYWANGQCVAEFCLLDSTRKTVVMLVNWINEFFLIGIGLW